MRSFAADLLNRADDVLPEPLDASAKSSLNRSAPYSLKYKKLQKRRGKEYMAVNVL